MAAMMHRQRGGVHGSSARAGAGPLGVSIDRAKRGQVDVGTGHRRMVLNETGGPWPGQRSEPPGGRGGAQPPYSDTCGFRDDVGGNPGRDRREPRHCRSCAPGGPRAGKGGVSRTRSGCKRLGGIRGFGVDIGVRQTRSCVRHERDPTTPRRTRSPAFARRRATPVPQTPPIAPSRKRNLNSRPTVHNRSRSRAASILRYSASQRSFTCMSAPASPLLAESCARSPNTLRSASSKSPLAKPCRYRDQAVDHSLLWCAA